MLAIELNPDLEQRLNLLVEKTGRSVGFFARAAIEQHLEDLEDYYLVHEAAETAKKELFLSPEELKRELDL